MPNLQEIDISNISEFIDTICQLPRDTDKNLWFRGVGDAVKHKLVPSLYRNISLTDIDDFIALESKLV